jgi:hypothetical protein
LAARLALARGVDSTTTPSSLPGAWRHAGSVRDGVSVSRATSFAATRQIGPAM